MTSKKETFASLIESFQYKYDLSTVFDDFLTLSLCSVTRNPLTGLSHYEDLYMGTIQKYAKDELRFQFPKLFDALVDEMEDRMSDSKGNDVLGDYYEMHQAKKGLSQFFTPWSICTFMAKSSFESVERTDGRPLRVLEPACGSGRMLVTAAREVGPDNEFYAVDVDQTCVKMTALNLFLNGVFHAEVMCGDFLFPDDFRHSYVVSFLPLGIFRIDTKEESRLWHLMKNTLEATKKQKPALDLKLPSESQDTGLGGNVSQITLF